MEDSKSFAFTFKVGYCMKLFLNGIELITHREFKLFCEFDTILSSEYLMAD